MAHLLLETNKKSQTLTSHQGLQITKKKDMDYLHWIIKIFPRLPLSIVKSAEKNTSEALFRSGPTAVKNSHLINLGHLNKLQHLWLVRNENIKKEGGNPLIFSCSKKRIRIKFISTLATHNIFQRELTIGGPQSLKLSWP